MRARVTAIAVLVLTLLVVAACGVSFADAADGAIDPCGAGKSWGLAKLDSSASVKLLLSVPAVPIASVDLVAPAPRWAGVEDASPLPSRVAVVQPRAPRGPPLA